MNVVVDKFCAEMIALLRMRSRIKKENEKNISVATF